MIEKLSEYEITSRDSGAFINVECNTKIINTLVRKLNELCDAVNELQKNATISKMEKVEPTDPYAEQRKWIGKLCKFRDNPACEWKYGILEKIYEDAEFPFWDTDCYEYAECELVKQDDDIIYKGENNE